MDTGDIENLILEALRSCLSFPFRKIASIQPRGFLFSGGIMNIRKFYEQQTNIPVPDDFDIHHIDGNRKNNDIENLVALPTKLHLLYHTRRPEQIHLDFNIRSPRQGGPAFLGRYIEQLEEFASIFDKCLLWTDFRDRLLGYFCLSDIVSYEDKRYAQTTIR